MAYATESDLAQYLGVSEADLPADAARLLERASELIDHLTLGRIDSENTEHTEAARKAACAQVEFWLAVDEENDIPGPIQGIIIGRMQIQYGAGSNRIAAVYVAPRARRYLLDAGLLYRGVSVS